MPLKAKEMERIVLADGWVFKRQVGSHRQYVHPKKEGKVRSRSTAETFRKGPRIRSEDRRG